jgi:hypothetical protein
MAFLGYLFLSCSQSLDQLPYGPVEGPLHHIAVHPGDAPGTVTPVYACQLTTGFAYPTPLQEVHAMRAALESALEALGQVSLQALHGHRLDPLSCFC